MVLGSHVALEVEVVAAMLDLAELHPGEHHIDLGSGDGRFVLEAQRRGAISRGIEIDPALMARSVAERGISVTCADLFTQDLSGADVLTAWFTEQPGVSLLLDKVRAELKPGGRFIFLYDSGSVGGGLPPHDWQPSKGGVVLGNKFWRYDG